MGTFSKVAIGGLLVSVGMISALSSLGSSLQEDFDAQANANGTAAANFEAAPPSAEVQNANVATDEQAIDEQLAGCKAALALMNDRDVSIFSGHRLDRDTVHVKWRRPDDGKQWEARCQKAGGNSLRWAAYNAFGDGRQGRWRDEDTITTEVEGGQITVELTQLGLGSKRASYALSELS